MKKSGMALCVIFATAACAGCENEGDVTGSEFATARQALSTTCEISLGGGGKTQKITHTFSSSAAAAYVVNTDSAWDFIRSTSGACKFTVYNEKSLGGRYVTLGSDLDERIRAGEEGVRYKDDGGGETWRVRSVKIEPVQTTECFLSIGGNGVRMHYYPGDYDKVPAMDRISYFFGGNCDAMAWNGASYGIDDSNNRFVGLHTNATNYDQAQARSDYDPGFRIRSIQLRSWGQSNCSSETILNRDFGRCLPAIKLPYSVYSTNANYDKDKDGLHDYLENMLAEAFTPIVYNHSTEDATRPYKQSDIDSGTADSYPYYDYLGNPVIEPVVVFQVRKSSTDLNNRIEIAYMQLWKKDVYNAVTCSGHAGDSQKDVFVLETPPAGNSLHGIYWWLKSTRAGYLEYKESSAKSAVAASEFSDATEVGGIDDPTLDPVDGAAFHHVWNAEKIAVQENAEIEALRVAGMDYDFDNDDDLVNMTEDFRSLAEKDSDKSVDLDGLSPVMPMIDDGTDDTKKSVNEFDWMQGNTHLRAPLFDRFGGDASSTNRHMLYYYSKGKHHAWQDTKFSGELDVKYCSDEFGSVLAHSYINARGGNHDPSYPPRLWNLKAPAGKGDAYHYNNVGSRNHYAGFVDSLTEYGFKDMRVWLDDCFYSPSAKAVDRVFMCSNNVNKLCCLEKEPNCTISSNWYCHE